MRKAACFDEFINANSVLQTIEGVTIFVGLHVEIYVGFFLFLQASGEAGKEVSK